MLFPDLGPLAHTSHRLAITGESYQNSAGRTRPKVVPRAGAGRGPVPQEREERSMAVTQLDGRAFEKFVAAGTYFLRKYRGVLNALHVFPVPDGDTGPNMFLT